MNHRGNKDPYPMYSESFPNSKGIDYKEILRTGWTSDIRLRGVLPITGALRIVGHIGFEGLAFYE